MSPNERLISKWRWMAQSIYWWHKALWMRRSDKLHWTRFDVTWHYVAHLNQITVNPVDGISLPLIVYHFIHVHMRHCRSCLIFWMFTRFNLTNLFDNKVYFLFHLISINCSAFFERIFTWTQNVLKIKIKFEIKNHSECTKFCSSQNDIILIFYFSLY